MIDIERGGGAETQVEKQAPCPEPDVGLNPGTPGSCPGPKAGVKLLSHPGVPFNSFSNPNFPFTPHCSLFRKERGWSALVPVQACYIAAI